MKKQTIDKKKSDRIAFIIFAGVILIALFGESIIDGILKLIYGI